MSWSAPEDWSRWDPEKLLVCPYDEVHMIKAKRFQQHLLKCRQNHPEKDFVTCPFNAKHVMLRSEFRHHVSRCPDRSVIEHYNYKGSEKDEDGFYFKGNTSVPSYHQTKEISQQASETWDADEDASLPWTEQNYTIRPQYNQGMTKSSNTVTDTLSLSPDEREKFKRQMRREAALRNLNSGIKLPSERCSNSQGCNRSPDNRIGGQPVSTNPVFRHCIEQNALSNSLVQEAYTADTPTSISSKPRNSIFNYCVGQMQNRSQHVTGQNNLQTSQINACRNVVQPLGANENISSQNSEHTTNRTLTSSAQENVELRSGFIESQMEKKLTLHAAGGELEVAKVSNVCEQPSSLTSSQHMTKTTLASSTQNTMELRSGFIESQMDKLTSHVAERKPEVAAVSNVCGQPTSPTSAGANGPQLAGVGRARLLAEARKNNFGGICYSPTKAAGAEITRAPPVGRGRGMLNFVMYSS